MIDLKELSKAATPGVWLRSMKSGESDIRATSEIRGTHIAKTMFVGPEVRDPEARAEKCNANADFIIALVNEYRAGRLAQVGVDLASGGDVSFGMMISKDGAIDVVDIAPVKPPENTTWEEWKGDRKCPFPPEQIIYVKRRNGKTEGPIPAGEIEDWCWDWNDRSRAVRRTSDIVQHRVWAGGIL